MENGEAVATLKAWPSTVACTIAKITSGSAYADQTSMTSKSARPILWCIATALKDSANISSYGIRLRPYSWAIGSITVASIKKARAVAHCVYRLLVRAAHIEAGHGRPSRRASSETGEKDVACGRRWNKSRTKLGPSRQLVAGGASSNSASCLVMTLAV